MFVELGLVLERVTVRMEDLVTNKFSANFVSLCSIRICSRFVYLVNLQAIETIGNNGATIGDASGRSQIVKMNLPTLLALGRCAARRRTLIIGRGILKSHGELVLADPLEIEGVVEIGHFF